MPVARNGTDQAVAKAAPSAESVAERRLVTVLFADLVGFTPFSEERDAEEVRETLSRYFDLAKEVVVRYGGTIEKFIGDAVMAVWGMPAVHEDDAERAVRAALDLVASVPGLGSSLQARAALLTGEAVVTLGATDQGMVAGDLVNTASRLQSAAAPGTVLVGEATQRAASKAIAFELIGAQQLKGKDDPITAWRALRVVAEVGGRNRSETLEPPFVGREEELRLLKDLLHGTSRERRARLVSITGVAGVGKSRLAWEFEKYLDGIVEQVRWHSGRSPAYGEGITFWALGEMVRSRAGLLETDDQATTRDKIAASAREWIPDEAERRWIESSLLALLGAGEPPPGGRDPLFAAWRTFFERIAEHDTVALVFQDLHWADTGTLDFIDHLLEWSRDQPIFIVTLARPELLERRPDWGAGKRNFTAIGLEPLAASLMRDLLDGLVPGLPGPTTNAIVARADGIPLYAVEMIRALVADGRLVELADGTYRPAADLGAITVPETLHALIAARLDSLDPADRALLQVAAVLGQSFTIAGLASISGVADAEVEPRLRSMVRKEILTTKLDARSPERGQYSFVQALFRDVAYNTLAKPDRKLRHLAAARWFESIGDEELAGALAAHYLAAYQSAPPGSEADALAAQARIALRAAGDRAADLGSHEQATNFYDQALTVRADELERVDLLQRFAMAASLAGRHDDAERRARQVLEIEEAQGEPATIARATAQLGKILLNGYRTDEALAVLEPAFAKLADTAKGEPAIAAVGGQLARAYFFKEQHRRAVEVAGEVLEAAERANDIAVVADTLVTKGSALIDLARLYEGIGLLRAGQALAEVHGLTETVFRALTNRVGHETTYDAREAYATASYGLGLARQMGWTRPTLTNNFVSAAMRVGDWNAALAETHKLLERTVDPFDWAQTAATGCSLILLRGDDADDLLEKLDAYREQASDDRIRFSLLELDCWRALVAGDLPRATGLWRSYAAVSALNAADSLMMAAHAALWSGDWAAAAQAVDQLDVTGGHGRLLDLVRRGLRAGVVAAQNRRAEALPIYNEVLNALREMDLPFDEALIAMDMVAVLAPDQPEARQATDRARHLLEQLSSPPLLALLESLPSSRSAPSAQQAARAKADANLITN